MSPKTKAQDITILPSHPRPQRNEILSSWMLRIASDNDVSILDICKWLKFKYPPFGLDSLEPDDPRIEVLAEAFGVRKEIVIDALPPWAWYLREGGRSKKLGNQYCPICLHESGHYQVSWVCAIYCCCLEHRCFLRDSCPHCGKPIRDASQHFRVHVSNPMKELRRCVYCKRSLLDCENPEFANDHFVKLTEILDLLIRNPDCDGFFNVLCGLFHTMCGQSTFAFQLRSRLLPNLRIESRHYGATRDGFPFLYVKSRALMLQAVIGLFAHWPDNLLNVLRMSPRYIHHLANTKPPFYGFLKDDTGLPPWYTNALHDGVLPLWYLKAIWIAHKQDGKPTKSNISAFLRTARREGWISVVQFADSTTECFSKTTTDQGKF